MALKLKENYKDLTLEYWKIISASEDYKKCQTIVRIALYKDKESREDDIQNFVKTESRSLDILDSDREALYAELKEPIIESVEEDGELVEINTNKFSNAIDC